MARHLAANPFRDEVGSSSAQDEAVAAGHERQRRRVDEVLHLRHGCASLLLAQGVHPRVVMEQLGHSTIALTMNTYSHVVPELQREAAERMEAALGGG